MPTGKGYVLSEADAARLKRLLNAFEGGKLEQLLGGIADRRPRSPPEQAIILAGTSGLADDDNQTPICILDHPWNGVKKIAYNFLDEPPTNERIQIAWHGVEPPDATLDPDGEFAPAGKWRLVDARAGHGTGVLLTDLKEGEVVTVQVDKLSASIGIPDQIEVYEVIGCAKKGERIAFSWNRGMLRYEALGAKCPCTDTTPAPSGSGGGCAQSTCTYKGVDQGGTLAWTLDRDCPGGCACPGTDQIPPERQTPNYVGDRYTFACGQG